MLNWQRRQNHACSPQAGTKPVRVGCVNYLNARPLWHGLGKRPDLFSLKYAVPSRVSAWLHNGEVDLALVSSIEYGPRYRVVPGAAVTSNGPVASVAAFSRKPLTRARSVALDSSSRTSAALMRILCAEWFDIEPEFVTMEPNLPAMLQRCDAALLIGDRALFVDHVGMGLRK
ncbi:MAG: menaquinone biosynthesis protein, partial [Caldilineaceae bacterium]|nr:menaquinone biosynthesis protein [Caldilineaceae bacterium]